MREREKQRDRRTEIKEEIVKRVRVKWGRDCSEGREKERLRGEE